MLWNISGGQLFAIIPMITHGLEVTAEQVKNAVALGDHSQASALKLKLQKAETAYQQLHALASLYENAKGEWPSEFAGMVISMRHITVEDRRILLTRTSDEDVPWLAKTRNGFMVAVGPDYLGLPWSEAFHALMAWASDGGYQWLEFSLSEKLTADLPRY